MASELPTGVLGTLANSVKNIVTGQSGDVHTIHTDVEEDVEVEDTEVDTLAVEKADRTEDTQAETATIHKEKAAAVVHEDVKPHELEKVNTVVDKDVHQDHYHTTIVPVKDTKVLPTKHVYQENEAQREIDHRNNAAKKAAKAEAAAIHNEKEVEKTTYSREFAPTKKEEHVHQ